ncbi:Hypothetical protein CINCED_3A010267 [Cinara cedri]|uniref:Uncharacterized protein n=1 Tax=Cinara cedri TaxID=506608 RepID=A0A5E4MCN6_9HEMI|nr:Hypothetical protein CINCED_3A010267 [Cinara cedri]
MPKRGKEPRSSSRHSVGRFSPTQSQRKSRNDYQVAGSSRTTSDSSSGRRSPHSKDNIKKSSGNTHENSSNQKHNMNVGDSPIILTDDDDDGYKNLDHSMNKFRGNGNKMNPGQDSGEGTRIVKHFVPSADRYMSQSAPEKPMFRGPETDVLRDLVKDKLKNIRVQMIRADVQQNDSFRQAYVVDDSVANRSKGEKNHQHVDDRQLSCYNSTRMHYDNGDKNYGMNHSLSPSRVMPRDRSISPQSNISRPPSPPLPYSPERDRFHSDNMLHRDRPKRSPERKVHERPSRDFTDQHKMNNFSSGPPEPRSPDMHRFRSGDHSRHRMKDDSIRFESRTRRSRSPPGYFRNNYSFKSPSPNNRSFSPSHGQLPVSPPSSRDLSPPLRDRPTYPNDRLRRRRSSPPRRDRSRDRRRHVSPRKRTSPGRSPIKRKDNTRKRPIKNQEGRKREAKDRKRRSQSNPKSTLQDQQQPQQPSFQQPQPIYPPPPGVVRLPPPPRPFPPMMIPLRPPPFPSMGAWRPRRPPIQAPPPSGWPYPRKFHKLIIICYIVVV